MMNGSQAVVSGRNGPTLLSDVPGLIVVAGAGGILTAYNMVIASGTVQSLAAYYSLSPGQLGATMSAALWGTLVGSVLFGTLRISRLRVGLRALAMLLLASSLGCALAASWWWLVIFRFIAGTAVGGAGVILPVYLARIAAPAYRGRIVGSFQLSIGVGVVLAYYVIFVVDRIITSFAYDWRVEFGCSVFPAALLLLLLRKDFGVDVAEGEVKALLSASVVPGENRLFCRAHLRPLLLAASLALFNQLTGINAILYYMNDMLSRDSVNHASADWLAFKLGVFNLFFGYIGIQLVDRLGRKPLLLWGALAMAGCLCRVGFIMRSAGSSEQLYVWFVLFNAAFGLSQGPVIWTYLSEIFPQRVSVKGLSWGSAVLWSANGILTFLFAFTLNRHRALPFFVFAAATLLQFIVVLWFFPETKGLKLDSSIPV